MSSERRGGAREHDALDLLAWTSSAAVAVLALVHSASVGGAAWGSLALPGRVAWPALAATSALAGVLYARARGAAAAGRNAWAPGGFAVLAASLALAMVAMLPSVPALAIAVGVALFASGFARGEPVLSERAALLFVLALIGTILAFATRPDGWTLAAFGVQSAVSLLALSREHSRAVRERAFAYRGGAPRQAAAATRPGARCLSGLAASLALASAALLVTGEIARKLRESGVRSEPARDGERAAVEGQPAEEPPLWGDRIGLGGKVGAQSDEMRAQVMLRSSPGGPPDTRGEPLYLVVRHLDLVTENGVEQASRRMLELHEDARDGELDGWTVFDDPRGRPLKELVVQQRPLGAQGGGGFALLRVEPLLAVTLPRVQYHPDALLAADERAERFEYRLIFAANEPRVAPGSTARALHPRSRFTELPPRSRELEQLAQAAAEIVRGARTDLERVEALMRHFQAFDYALAGTQRSGLAGMVEFLEQREGYCAAFASTATVMLRTLGLPARVVTGFLASEFDSESALYVLRARHGHAWIEVHFEGLGWVRFDPTPRSGEPPGAAAAVERDALAEWGAGALERARELALARPGAPSAAELARHLAQAPAAWWSAVSSRSRSGWMATLALAAALVGWLATRLWRAARSAAAQAPGRARVLRLEERLSLALARRGHARRSSQTLREVARAALAAEERALGGLGDAVELLYRARFGGVELDRGERRRVEAAIAAAEAPRAGAAQV